MADIRVTCPACKTQLEIGAEFEGQEVECGTCLEVFTATTKKAKPKTDDDDDRPASKSGSGGKSKSGDRDKPKSRASRERDDDDRPTRRRRDDDDDDDDYDRPRRRSGGGNGLAITSLILGIVAFIPGCCCAYVGGPIALGAIITGVIGMQKQEGKGMAIAGLILGGVWIALVILLLVANVGINMGNPQQRFR